MGRRRMPGLFLRKGVWHIDKQIYGIRLRKSTGSDSLSEAENFLAKKTEELRQAMIYGVRPKRSFEEATAKYLEENQRKASLSDDAGRIKVLNKHIGDLFIDTIHMGALRSFIDARIRDGIKIRTINHGLAVVRRILNLAAGEWIDACGLTWLLNAPKIKLLPEYDSRKPYPLSWEEQQKLFASLPLHLRRMALFAVNTGCRDKEICGLKWEWEIKVPELNTAVFIIPAIKVKNREDRLVVLNKVACAVIEEVRGLHPDYVFTFRGGPIKRMLNSGWKAAREKTDINVRVHDLKHTFGRRLRAAGVSFEDRQDLLGHRSGRITTHYSAVELINLIEAANKVCNEGVSTPTLVVLKSANPHKIPTVAFSEVGKKPISH